ncbi:MAG: transglutaminase domain-containing protein [Clostridiales bacterium]|nr:transglutaminase domain-containing protein [Clostridiales bacterium]
MANWKSGVCLLLILGLLCGCSDKDKSNKTEVPASQETGEKYEAPPFATSPFDETAAEGENGVLLDTSHVTLGYVAVSASASGKLKFQVVSGDEKYNYDLPSDGTPVSYVLQNGSGTYQFRVMKNTTGNQYTQIYRQEVEVELQDEFQPYLRPSQFVDYDENSQCVKKAAELVQTADSELQAVSAVFQYICDTVAYDKDKARTVAAGYLPDPDETLETGRGICFDYAALAAAMLRSQGIPTKMIFGYVSPNEIYHAWNMFYTEESGWVTVEYKVDSSTWERLDPTFSANGADSTFVGDGTNYADVYVY